MLRVINIIHSITRTPIFPVDVLFSCPPLIIFKIYNFEFLKEVKPMEHNQSIPKTNYIHKSISSLLFTVALLLCTAIINPITAHAYTTTEVEAEHSDGTYTSSNGTWLATYCPEAGAKGQGVLLYLLERNGGGPVSGTTPKAFACGATMESYELHAQDKYNRYPEVTHWEGTDPYWSGVVANNGGFINDNFASNVPAIKTWLKTTYHGISTNGIEMVADIWGPDIATRFTNEEIILVAEPIVAIQFSQYNKCEPLNFSGTLHNIKAGLVLFKNRVKANKHTVMSGDLRKLIDNYITDIDKMINGETSHQEISTNLDTMGSILSQFTTSTNLYKPLGNTYAGTSKMVASYYASLTASPDAVVTWYKSDSGRNFYRKYTSASAFIPQGSIICANANFNLLPPTISARQIHSDSNLQTYSIGMLAMLAFTEDKTQGEVQTTCDESKLTEYNPEHPAPIESNGTTTIIKSYRIRNTETNTLTDRGTHTRSNLSNQILIEDEDDYKVIAWKTSTENITNLANFSVTWESSVPGIIGEQGDTITQVTLPSTHKYIYVLLEKSDNPDEHTNYTIPQSSITRHIYLSQPDKRLGMPKIEAHTFTWYIPSFTEGSCKHTYTCNSSDCSNKSYGTCNCNPCKSDCTIYLKSILPI